jgi:hypothetical protein
MNAAVARRFSAERPNSHPDRWATIALFSVLTFTLIWTGGVPAAFAVGFGAGAVVRIGEPSNEDPSDFFLSNPGILVNAGQLLVPPIVRPGEVSPAYTSGVVSASIPGFAAADLAAGTLSSFASSGDEGSVVFTTTVGVGFSDTLKPADNGIEQFTLTITGTFTGPSSLSGAWFAIDARVLLGTRGEPDADGCFEALDGTNSCTYVFDVPVTAGVPFQFASALYSSVNDGILDLTHTARLGVAGVPFTSESGVFLTAINAPPEPAPEPATLLVLGSGLAGLGGSAWRKRRRK